MEITKTIIKFINRIKKQSVYFKTLCFFIFIYLFSKQNSSGQTFLLYGDKTFGGSQLETTSTLIQKNNNLILMGLSGTICDGDKTDSLCLEINSAHLDGWLIEIDSDFNIISQNNLGGSQYEVRSYINGPYNDGNYFLSFASSSDSSCDKEDMSRGLADYWICQFDSSNNPLWQKTFGGSNNDSGNKTIQTLDGKIWMVGQSLSDISGDKTVANFGDKDFWIVKTDSVGNILWDKVYGSSGIESGETHYWDFISYDSSGIILAGNTYSNPDGMVTGSSRGFYDFWIVKIDSAGSKLWDKRFGGDFQDLPKKIIATSDSNYIIAGFTNSQQSFEVSEPALGDRDFWVVKIDTSGDIIWDRRYGGSGSDEASWIERADNGGFWVGGTTQSGVGGDVTEPAYGISDYWIIKIDSLGNKIWDKRFGGPHSNTLTSFTVLPDSSLMLFGTADTGTSAVKTDFGKGNQDYWLVHFKYSDSTTSIIEPHVLNYNMFPNPVITSLSITADKCFDCTFVLSDVTGKILITDILTQKLEIDMSEFSSGIYFFEIGNQDRISQKGKFIKL